MLPNRLGTEMAAMAALAAAILACKELIAPLCAEALLVRIFSALV